MYSRRLYSDWELERCHCLHITDCFKNQGRVSRKRNVFQKAAKKKGKNEIRRKREKTGGGRTDFDNNTNSTRGVYWQESGDTMSITIQRQQYDKF